MAGDISRDSFDARKHYDRVVMQQGRVQLDADWNEQQNIHRHRAETQARDIAGTGAPLHDAGFLLTATASKSLTIGKGRYYVAGLLCENESDVDFSQQPDCPNAPAFADILTKAVRTTAIVYLDAWRREITPLEDPSLREVALGGADTANRVKTIWQVKALPVQTSGSGAGCGDSFPEWDALVAPGTGLMSARAVPPTATNNPCLLPPGAGYQRLDNQLYRIEAHKGGALATATFKWSRDNGSVVTAIETFNGQTLTVHDLGRDDTLGFSNGQWVEILDDSAELAGTPGPLIQIDHVDLSARTITLKSAPTAVAASLHPKIRRWDGAGETPLAAPAGGNGWVALEDGVEVKFEDGNYNPGDYWLVPARTVTGDVDWPFSAPQPPRGPDHRYCRIGIATLSSAALTVQDCRKTFAPLAELPPALHITGLSWLNDDVMTQAQLAANGLQIFFDAGPTPTPGDSASASVTVSIDSPVEMTSIAQAPTTIGLPLSIQLGGDISFPSANVLQWKPAAPGTDFSNLSTFLVGQKASVGKVRVRVRLLGSAIWKEQNGQRLYLDGRALGQSGLRGDGVTPRVDLSFPTGEGRRSSDFESWFYLQLTPPPANLLAVTINPSVVNAGAAATGTVMLDNPAPAAGVTVTLSSSSANVVIQPNSVVVAAGQLQATFPITTSANAPNSQTVTISAVANNVTQTTSITLQVINVSISPAAATLFVGHSQQFSATVSGGDDKDVTWSADGGSINSSGLFVATVVGAFHIVATSTADPKKTAAAVVNVTQKPKDKEKEKEKEHKEIKEIKEGKEGKEGNETKEIVREKLTDHLVGGHIGAFRIDPPASAGEVDLPVGRAFIRAFERPDLTPGRQAPH
ncbi:MAG TPA: DUF6519 domain-containing protein [Rhodoblastus sp.]|nr:DUF6519 domain-containing protein [Rhodoblastus sp.]